MPNSSGAGEEDQAREARAYNTSVYLMVGMPYLLLGAVGVGVYRGLRQKALAESAAADADGHGSGTSSNENENGTSTSPAGVR